MPISELVFGSLRRAVAKEGLYHIRKGQPAVFRDVPGNLFNNVGHVIKHNGKDISEEYKPVLTLEWDRADSFHAFYPASAAFQPFVELFAPYAAAKAQPQLYQPSQGSLAFKDLMSQGAAQIFVGTVAADKKEDVAAAWKAFLEAAKEDGLQGQWEGWGVDGNEGTWAGILNWKEPKESEWLLSEGEQAEHVRKLKGLGDLDEYWVTFAAASDTAE